MCNLLKNKSMEPENTIIKTKKQIEQHIIEPHSINKQVSKLTNEEEIENKYEKEKIEEIHKLLKPIATETRKLFDNIAKTIREKK